MSGHIYSELETLSTGWPDSKIGEAGLWEKARLILAKTVLAKEP